MGFLAIFAAVVFMFVGNAINEDVAFLAFAVGWIAVGIACFYLGRRWNRVADIHRTR